MREKPTVYLAGPIFDSDDGGSGWRNDVVSEYRDVFDFHNPLSKYDTNVDNLITMPRGMHGTVDVPEGSEVVYDHDIVETDLRMIRDSDAMLVGGWSNDVHSTGTPMEIAYNASAMVTVPVVVVTQEEVLDLSVWLRYHADAIATTYDQGIEALKHLLEYDEGETS